MFASPRVSRHLTSPWYEYQLCDHRPSGNIGAKPFSPLEFPFSPQPPKRLVLSRDSVFLPQDRSLMLGRNLQPSFNFLLPKQFTLSRACLAFRRRQKPQLSTRHRPMFPSLPKLRSSPRRRFSFGHRSQATSFFKPHPTFRHRRTTGLRYIRPTSATHLFCCQRRASSDISELLVGRSLLKAVSRYSSTSAGVSSYLPNNRRNSEEPSLFSRSEDRASSSRCCFSVRKPESRVPFPSVAETTEVPGSHTADRCQMLPQLAPIGFQSSPVSTTGVVFRDERNESHDSLR